MGRRTPCWTFSAAHTTFDLGDPDNYTPAEQVVRITGTTWQDPKEIEFNLSQESAESLFNFRGVIAQAIADRQKEIDRLQAEIETLSNAERILGASPPGARR